MSIHRHQKVLGALAPLLIQNEEPSSHYGGPSPEYSRHIINTGTALYRVGAPSSSLFLIISGFFKITEAKENGNEQVLGFHFPNEIIGLDGLDKGQHCLNVIALVESSVMRIPFFTLQREGEQTTDYRHEIYARMCEELIREQYAIFTLGSMDAKAKVGTFILQLSDRFKKLGHSPSEFNLFMSQNDMASYLGLPTETISLTFSLLEDKGLISADTRSVRILNRPGLEQQIREGNQSKME